MDGAKFAASSATPAPCWPHRNICKTQRQVTFVRASRAAILWSYATCRQFYKTAPWTLEGHLAPKRLPQINDAEGVGQPDGQTCLTESTLLFLNYLWPIFLHFRRALPN